LHIDDESISYETLTRLLARTESSFSMISLLGFEGIPVFDL